VGTAVRGDLREVRIVPDVHEAIHFALPFERLHTFCAHAFDEASSQPRASRRNLEYAVQSRVRQSTAHVHAFVVLITHTQLPAQMSFEPRREALVLLSIITERAPPRFRRLHVRCPFDDWDAFEHWGGVFFCSRGRSAADCGDEGFLSGDVAPLPLPRVASDLTIGARQ